MSTGIHRRIRFHSADRRKVLTQESAKEETSPGRIPRVARLMALAIQMETLIASGRVACYADAARLAHVTRARMTQIMNLTRLAPDIQEAVLFLAPVVKGRDPVTERDLRPIAAEFNWSKQRELWARLIGSGQRVTH